MPAPWRVADLRVNFNGLTCFAFHTLITGMPAMEEFGSSSAALFTVSLAPITNTRSASGKSSFISSISSTTSEQRLLVYWSVRAVGGSHTVRNTSFCQKDIQLARHSPRDGMN